MQLARTGATQDEIAERVGVSRGLVSMWLSGQRVPRAENRTAIRKRYGIREATWDQPRAPARSRERPSTPPPPAPGEPAPPPALEEGSSVRAKALRLGRMVQELLDGIANDTFALPLERAKVMASAASTLTLLGKLSGETQEISEQRILRLPAWRRIEDVIAAALDPWPEAMRAVGEALRAIGEAK